MAQNVLKPRMGSEARHAYASDDAVFRCALCELESGLCVMLDRQARDLVVPGEEAGNSSGTTGSAMLCYPPSHLS